MYVSVCYLELQSSISKFSQQCDQHVQYKASLEEKMEALDSQLSFLQKSNNHLTEEVHMYMTIKNKVTIRGDYKPTIG